MQHDFKKQKKFDDAFFTDKMIQTLSGTLALIGILGIMYATKNDTKSGVLEEPTETTIKTHKYPIREHYRKIITYEDYEIKVGDNLTMIAEKYNTTIEKILAANSNITNPNIIQPGDILTIPIEKIIVLPEKRLQENLIRGIDISHYQGNIDWQQVKDAGIEFVIMRIGVQTDPEETLDMDTRYKEYLASAKAVGLKIGVYVYNTSINRDMGIKTAKFVLDTLDGEKLDIPIVYDWENWKKFMNYNISLHTLKDAYDGFKETIEAAGYESTLYSSKYYLN